MKIEDINIGNNYYVRSRYECKSCFRVKIIEIVDEKTALVEGMQKKSNKKAKPFKIYVDQLHKTSHMAVGGYKQHH